MKCSNSEAKKRLLECHKCEHLEKPFIGSPKCKVCGCIVKLKVQLSRESCPLDKW